MKYKTLLVSTLALILGFSVGYYNQGTVSNTPTTITTVMPEQPTSGTREQDLIQMLKETQSLHTEDVSIKLEADEVTCGQDTPIKAEITNTSRQGKVMDGVIFYTSAIYKNSHHVLGDYNEPFVSVKLDLHPNETTFRCFAVPHEVVADMQYDNGDSTYRDYWYSPTTKSIVFRGE